MTMTLNTKILLLLDNALAQSSVECLQSSDGKVTSIFLPANNTSIQPMDQGVVEALKNRCKKKSPPHHLIILKKNHLLYQLLTFKKF